MTTTQLKTAILSYPNCSVELSDCFVNDVYLHVELTYSILMVKHSKGVDMANDRECVQIKDRYVEILEKIKSNQFAEVGVKKYSSFSALCKKD